VRARRVVTGASPPPELHVVVGWEPWPRAAWDAPWRPERLPAQRDLPLAACGPLWIRVVAPGFSCAGEDETPPGMYSEPSDDSMSCAMGLECRVGICTQGCTTTAECRANLGAPRTECIGGACQDPCSPTDFMPCSNGLSCKQTPAGSTCRP